MYGPHDRDAATRLLLVVGTVRKGGRLSQVADELLSACALNINVRAARVDVYEADLPLAGGLESSEVVDLTRRVAGAEAVIFCSPVFRASLPGSLKNLIDWLPVEALRGKPVGLVTVGATTHHYLAVDSHFRDIMAWFGALSLPGNVYVTLDQVSTGSVSEVSATAIRDLVGSCVEAASLLRGRPPLGTAPLAAIKSKSR